MEQNNVRTYVLYAIGEIALVMIGILLALQVNNWNQQRIDAQKESRYVSELARDLNSQLVQIESMKESLTMAISDLNTILALVPVRENVDESFSSLFLSVIARTSFTVIDPTYEELLSTGNIELIKNEVIRNDIITYYQQMNKSELIIQKNNDINDLTIMPASMRLMEYWPPGYLNQPNSAELIGDIDVSDFPNMFQHFDAILNNDQVMFELMNLVKLKLIISSSNLRDTRVAETLTYELIEKLQTY